MSAPVRAAVCGACGRMGSLIVAKLNAAEGIEVSAAFDIVNNGLDIGEIARIGKLNIPVSHPDNMTEVLKESKTDVLIDFTVAPATVANVPKATAAGVNLIIGTTGLTDAQKADIAASVAEHNVAAVISSNYSIGVNVFFKLLKEAAGLLGDYDIEIIEAHHNQKKDAPSGTAKTAARSSAKLSAAKTWSTAEKASARAEKRSASTPSAAATSSATTLSCSSATLKGSRSATRLTPARIS